jgi:hypothetical protein
MYRVFSDIYNTVLRKNTNPKYILREFQVAISQVHKWTLSKKNMEFDKANEIDKRITSLIRVNMRGVIKKTISPERVRYAMEELPDAYIFYHLCLVEISRELYRYPSLMYHNVDTFTRRKNRENIKEIVYGAVDKTLISVIPVFSDTESDDDAEVDREDKYIEKENNDENAGEINVEYMNATDEIGYDKLQNVNNYDDSEIRNEKDNENRDNSKTTEFENNDKNEFENDDKFEFENDDKLENEKYEKLPNGEYYQGEITETNVELDIEKKNLGIAESYGNSFEKLNNSLEIYRNILEREDSDIYENDKCKQNTNELEHGFENLFQNSDTGDTNKIIGGSSDNGQDYTENSGDIDNINNNCKYIDGICDSHDTKSYSVSPRNMSCKGEVIIDIRDMPGLNNEEYVGTEQCDEKKNNYLCMKSLAELMRNGSGSTTPAKKRFDEYSHLSYEPFSESDDASDIKLEDETESSDSNADDTWVSKQIEYDDMSSDEELETDRINSGKTMPIEIPLKSSNIKGMSTK